jgi:hypothetical protein
MDLPTTDLAIISVVVAARFLVPLLILRYPLPAIVAALVIDGVDQTVFQTQLTPSSWHRVEDGYQGYDKALDVYYLSLAYVATLRNWANRTALNTAQFLWLYRLAGVTVFEVVHDPADPSSWRWLLLVFPNTFEYFFIAYETIRVRWDPRRLSPATVIGLAAAIWVFVKLPQEWWIHVAQLDFTDFAAAHGWVTPTITVLLVSAAAGMWLFRDRFPAPDWTPRIVAPPLPASLRTAAERAAVRAATGRLLDRRLLEKVVLVGLLCVDFAQILPGTTATPSQVITAVGVLVVVNAGVGLGFARRGWTIENTAAQIVVLSALNLALVWIAQALSPRFDPQHATFFVVLISLVVGLYDRYSLVREARRRADITPEPV